MAATIGAAEPPAAQSWQLTLACVVALLAVLAAMAVWSLRLSLEQKQLQPPTAAGAAGAARAKAKAKAKAAGADEGVRPRGALDRMQRGAAAATAAARAEDDDGDDGEDGDEGAEGGAQGVAGREGRRNAQKEQKRLEKKAQQDAVRTQRQQKDVSKSESQMRHEMRLANKDADRQQLEDEDAKEREAKTKTEVEELDSWKHLFSVEAAGEEGKSKAEPKVSTEDFVQYVKVRKVVHLEDLAAHFQMRTASAIERLKQLEKLERLSGIFDDRGKYIHITPEEMKGVADWLRKQGRVGRGDLVAACNRIVRLNPTAEDKARIEEEARAAMATLEDGEAES